jgi:glyoxylase-like metal-dependent hydrolase (beta-lactamase superfamily II)
MSASRFEQIHDRVWRINCPFEGGGHVHLYLVRGSKTALIDSGVFGNPTNDVAPALAELGLALGDVDYLLNSHGHMDHLGGNGEMKDAGAEIWIHSADAPRTESNQFHSDQAAEWLSTLGLAHLAESRGAFLLRLLGKEVGADRLLENGDSVDLGDDVKLSVVHTPEHSPGSVSYFLESAGVMLTGDSIQARSVHPGGLPVIEDPAMYAVTVDRVAEMPVEMLCMGHNFQGPNGALGPTPRGEAVKQVFRESKATHLAILGAFKAAVASSPGASNMEIVRKAVDSLRDEYKLRDDPVLTLPAGGYMTLPGYLALARA